MATPINFYWYKRKELSIQRDQANQQKAEFEKEIEKLLFDNREIKEHSRKTQRELSKEISSLTSELKDERDRIHELQKENRKLRQEVKTGHKTKCPTRKTRSELVRDFLWPVPVRDQPILIRRFLCPRTYLRTFGSSYLRSSVPRIFNLIKRWWVIIYDSWIMSYRIVRSHVKHEHNLFNVSITYQQLILARENDPDLKIKKKYLEYWTSNETNKIGKFTRAYSTRKCYRHKCSSRWYCKYLITLILRK